MGQAHSTQRTNDDDLSRIFGFYLWGELYVMRNAMRRWKRPRRSRYDTFVIRMRSFTDWPHLFPTPASLSASRFSYTDKPCTT